MRRLIVLILPLALIPLAQALVAADNHRVAAKNDLGRKNSNESNARVRYAVVDLGTSQKPTRITNSGIVLFSDPFSSKRWVNGTLETLGRGHATDINDAGTAVGWITSNEFYFASSFRLRTQPGRPFTELAAVWPIGQTAAVPLSAEKFDFDVVVTYTEQYGFLGYSIEPYTCTWAVGGNPTEGYWGGAYTPDIRFKGAVQESRAFTIDNNGAIYGEAVPPDGFQTRGDCPRPDIFGAVVDGFGWGGGSSGQLGKSRLELDASGRRFNVTGEVRKITTARNGHTIGSKSGGVYSYLVDDVSVSYTPLKLNSRGFVLTTVGRQYAIASPAAITQPISTGISWWTSVYALNHREVSTVDAAGTSVARSSPQLVGHDYDYYSDAYDYTIGTLLEEDGATGKYTQTKLNNLIPPDSGWHIAYAYDINDNGWIIGNGWYQQEDAAGNPVGSPQWRACLLAPVELVDTKNKIHDDSDDVIVEPKAAVGEQNRKSIALIEPHGSEEIPDAPDMPQLALRLRGTENMGLKIKWKLQVRYARPRGDQPNETTIKEQDDVYIPRRKAGEQPWHQEGLDGSVEFYAHPDWMAELAQTGFFGGEAELRYQLLYGDGVAFGAERVVLFSVGGKNPDPAKCKRYIDSQAKSAHGDLWFAYAIAKSESSAFNKAADRYNQFWTWTGNYDKRRHQEAEPTWAKASWEQSAGGFGMFQVTGDITGKFVNIGRDQLWNWQTNVLAGLVIVRHKQDAEYDGTWDYMNATTPHRKIAGQPRGQRAQAKRANNNVPVSVPDETVRSVTFKDDGIRAIEAAVTIKAYNGALRHYCGWNNASKRWEFFRTNGKFNYVDRVCQEIE